MKIITDVVYLSKTIKEIISANGRLAQHQYDLYLNYGREGERHVFFDAGKSSGIMAYQKKDVWRVFTDPAAPPPEKKKILLEAVDWIFKNSPAKKIVLEDITDDLKREIFAAASENKWRPVKSSYSLVWPVIDLVNWSGEGGDLKRTRNAYHKFFRDNYVKFKDAGDVNGGDLKNLILKWKAGRNDNDRVHLLPYLRFVDANFNGFDLVRLMVIGGRPVSIAAGWAIPNSRGAYYSCVGIYDYDYKNIGEAAYWDELFELKKIGYKRVDLGGSEGGLLSFKMKFRPSDSYITHTFSILRQ